MSAIRFVSALVESGRVPISPPGAIPDDWAEAVVELDRLFRSEMPGDAPPLNMPAAVWGLRLLYHCCQFLAYREVEADAVRTTLAETCPESPSPSVCYSADLALRYLPDVFVLARGIAPGDPLVESMANIAAAWPLSSVGMKLERKLDIRPFISDYSLRQMYADRIIEKADGSRLDDPEVRETVTASLGNFAELAPRVSAALRSGLGEL